MDFVDWVTCNTVTEEEFEEGNPEQLWIKGKDTMRDQNDMIWFILTKPGTNRVLTAIDNQTLALESKYRIHAINSRG